MSPGAPTPSGLIFCRGGGTLESCRSSRGVRGCAWRIRPAGHMGAPRATCPRVRPHPTATKVDSIAERTATIMRCYKAGDTPAEMAKRVRLSRASVLKIIRDFDPPKPQPHKCAVEDCPTVTRSSNNYCSRHQARFERFGDPVWKRPPVNDEHGTMVRYKRDRCRCELCRRRNTDRATEYLHRVHPEMGYNKPHKDSGGMRGAQSPSVVRDALPRSCAATQPATLSPRSDPALVSLGSASVKSSRVPASPCRGTTSAP